MLGLLALLWALQLPGSQAAITLEQPLTVLERRGSSAILPCTVHTKVSYIHWYRHQEGRAPERLLVMAMLKSDVRWDSVLKADKVTAMESKDGSSCTLSVLRLEKNDEGRYYCAAWYHRSGWIKIFAEGTKLIVIPPDKRLVGDFSPKPTVFLPSVAEVNHDNSGTYLCLLEKFFPDAIKVEWKEKNVGTVLESQQGNTIKNGDTYMKFSWLTVTKKSMDREHRCIVKHEFNKGRIDQEIPFPPIDKGNADGDGKSEDANQEDGNGALQLQFANTAAHYTYVLLILKSSIYLAIVTFCLFKRAEVCGNGKSSSRLVAQ